MPEVQTDPRLQKILAAISAADPRMTYGESGFSNAGNDTPAPKFTLPQPDQQGITESQSLIKNPDTLDTSQGRPRRATTADIPQPQTRPRYSGAAVSGDPSTDIASQVSVMQGIDPSQQIQRTGTRIGYGAPKKRSRLGGAFDALYAVNQATQGQPTSERLPAQLAALAGGGFKPNIGQAMRRQAEIREVQGEQARQLAVDKEQAQIQGIGSQAASREANIAAAQDRVNNQSRGLDLRGKELDQRDKQSRAKNLLSDYNGQTDFDPDDPQNAAFVAQFEQEFGHRPVKKIRGSLLQYQMGYDAQGNPVATIINKGTGQATQVTGDVPAQTEGSLNRKQRGTEGAANRASRERIAANSQAGADRRAGQKSTKGPSATGNRLVDAYNKARVAELGGNAEKSDELRNKRENLWNQVMKAYPGQYEASGDGQLVPKAASQFEPSPDTPAPEINTELMPKKGTKGISRAVFRRNNAALVKGKSNAEVDAIISEGGYVPLP